MITNGLISINKPCHQEWENMSISEQGRFCSSCKKEVRDFENANIGDIKKAYSESVGGMCGRIPVKLMQEQYAENETRKLHFSYLKKFCLAAVLCFGANLFTIDSAKASTFYKVRTAFFNFAGDNNKDTIIVKGVVKDKRTHERMAFVNVSVMHDDSMIYNYVTNANGEYEVKIPKQYSTVDIRAIYVGYETNILKNVHVSINKKSIINIDMIQGAVIMMGDIEYVPEIKDDSVPSEK